MWNKQTECTMVNNTTRLNCVATNVPRPWGFDEQRPPASSTRPHAHIPAPFPRWHLRVFVACCCCCCNRSSLAVFVSATYAAKHADRIEYSVYTISLFTGQFVYTVACVCASSLVRACARVFAECAAECQTVWHCFVGARTRVFSSDTLGDA